MSEKKVLNYTLSSVLILTAVMLSWTFIYINQIAEQTQPQVIVTAFSA